MFALTGAAMPLPNISCSKTDETFKNKQTLARTKGILKWRFRNFGRVAAVAAANSRRAILGALTIVLITSRTSALEIEESMSINKPIVRDVPDLPGWVHFSSEYVRCFCNLPACVSTGYMCKSSGGGCFSDLLDQVNQALPSNVYRGIHGCLELLTDRNQKNWCQNTPGGGGGSTSASIPKKKSHPRSLLLCCYHDMCNHVDSPETKTLLNDTVVGEIMSDSDKLVDNVGPRPDPALYTESEVWFRAATIAVPICGSVILLALIALAVRLLRTESIANRDNKLGLPSSYMLPPDNKTNRHPSYRHHNVIHKDSQHHNPIYSNDSEDVRGQTYVPLLIQDDAGTKGCDKKNETNAKLNFIQELENCPANARDEKAAIAPQNLFHKNTDLHVGRNMILLDSVADRPDSTVDKMYNKESIS